jgi:hypothetical protein
MSDKSNIIYSAEKVKKGRGPTDLAKFWKKHGPQNKVHVEFNHLGQPCGLKTARLSNFISYLVKGKDVSLAYYTWRQVPESEKEKLWMSVQVNTVMP